MKPPPFEYYRATTVEEAVALLGQYGPDARVLAGGQSLLPMLKFRLARPSVLVDLNRVHALAYVRQTNGRVAFGAMARLADLESDQVRARCPMLAEAAQHIGHPAIRHRGTVCGSLAHADPAAELPVLALALDAELVATGSAGVRVIPAQDFFVSLLTTGLESSEILTEARFPLLRPTSGWGFGGRLQCDVADGVERFTGVRVLCGEHLASADQNGLGADVGLAHGDLLTFQERIAFLHRPGF